MSKTLLPLSKVFSHIISNVMNPLFSLLIFFIYYGNQKMDKTTALFNLILVITIIIIPIYTWIYWNVKTGKYTNMDVSDRKQRNSLYVFNFVVMLVYLSILFLTHQSSSFIKIIIYVLLLMILMQFSNRYIKSSMHTAFNVFVAILFYTLSPFWGIFWAGLTVLLGISRIILKRHTIQEVILGTIIALCVGLIYINNIF